MLLQNRMVLFLALIIAYSLPDVESSPTWSHTFATKHFNNILSTGNFPTSWRQEHVMPLLKPGKSPNKPSSYRPLALASFVCKIMERMVNSRLV